MNDTLTAQLVAAALAARNRAYAPYSQFAVGAALHTVDGRTITGSNVENASYGLTICAERSAIASANDAGSRQFTMLAIASSGGVTPCGACRQVLAEFCDDLPIVLVDAEGKLPQKIVYLAQLLPGRFTL